MYRFVFFVKQKTAYEMRISDWSSDVCSSDLRDLGDLTASEYRQLRGRDMAMIFQDPMMTLNPVLRVDTQMVEAVRAHERVSRKAARDRAIQVLGIDRKSVV